MTEGGNAVMSKIQKSDFGPRDDDFQVVLAFLVPIGYWLFSYLILICLCYGQVTVTEDLENFPLYLGC